MKTSKSYEVYYPSGHEFIQNEFLPSFYHNGPSGGYRNTRIKINRNNLEMRTVGCDFCADVNAQGSLGSFGLNWYQETFNQL